jgi:transcription elongation factor GreA
MEALKKKLKDELDLLNRELRSELPKEILKARAHGDLSENAEYHAAKERQRFVESRLSQLGARLQELSMIDMSKIPKDRVGLFSKVVVFDEAKEEELSYELVTSEEADVANGKISTTSPIGRSLLGKKVGDSAKVHTPNGVREFEVVELTTVHGAS